MKLFHLIALLLLMVSPAARADTVADFYRGKQVSVLVASESFFRVLGVQPAMGRAFLKEEETPGKNHTVVLLDGFWRRRLLAAGK